MFRQQTFWLKVCIGLLTTACLVLGYALYQAHQVAETQLADTVHHEGVGQRQMGMQESQIHKYDGIGYKIY